MLRLFCLFSLRIAGWWFALCLVWIAWLRVVVYLDCLWLFALVEIGGGGGCRLNCGWLLGLWCLILD